MNKVVSQVACPAAIGIFSFTQSTQSTRTRWALGKIQPNIRFRPIGSGTNARAQQTLDGDYGL